MVKGFGSAYLWALKRGERRIKGIEEELTEELLKELSSYEMGVCAYCPQLYCEPDKLLECYRNFEREKDGK